jgi:hypothetical protein
MKRRLWILSCAFFVAGLSNPVWAENIPGIKEVPPAPIRWAANGPGGTPDYIRNVQPLLGKMGCSNRACHGSFQGQGGFRLSLFGSDPKLDVDNLLKDPKGARVDVKDPEASLALLKPTLQMPHKGGKRFEVGSWQFRLLKEWIAAGAKLEPAKEPLLERLEVIPNQMVLPKEGGKASLKILAHYSDHAVEDVTALTQFSSNDAVIAPVSEDGLVTAGTFGDTAIVATFGGSVSTAHVLVPQTGAQGRTIHFAAHNKIDELVAAKWQKLGIQPAELSDDAEFFRRVSLDLIGTLPTPEELRGFLADKSPDKRAKQIETLLQRPEYALFWATRYSDLTGNDDRFLPQPRQKIVWLWYDWLKDKFQRNTPYDELVAGIVTATTRENRPVEEVVQEHKKITEAMASGFDPGTYAQRRTNDIFWKKSGNRGDQVALQIAYAFLGIRLECAQCHKHPFDRWTQEDFKSYTAFFTPVRVGVPKDVPKDAVATGNNRQNYPYTEVFVQIQGSDAGGAKGKQNKNRVDPSKGPKPRTLGGSEYPFEEGKDPREALMNWMRAADNPFFAKAVVNRMWAHYFGVGIVDPADDMNAANPPSNPALLDWLAKDFVEHHFDLKHLHRTILNSRVYQINWKTNPTNELDRRNFSHALLRRLPAEVVVDAIDQATGNQPNFPKNMAPAGTRAIGLAPSRLNNAGIGYALAIFGRPLRTQTCDCERSGDAGLPQAMYLMNDTEVNNKISNPKGRLAKLLKDISDDGQLVEELYLGTVSRFPTDPERKKALDYVAKAGDRKAGFEDVLWSLINLREFVFNH